MKVILVCVGNFQCYILNNLKNLLLYNNKDISVITEKEYFSYFNVYKDIELVDCNELSDLNFNKNSKLDGFWHFASVRLFYLYSYIKKYNLKNIIHLENDTLLYENADKLTFKQNKVYATYDCYTRVIPGLLYIPNYEAFEPIVLNYKNELDDMKNMALHKDKVEALPIFPNFRRNEIINKNFKDFNVIFDAAAIGQYLGGIFSDKKYIKDTRGFVNETCMINYSYFKFIWKKGEDNLYRPYIIVDDKEIQIINLHIHSKQLYKFIGDNPLETKYINKIN